MATKRNARGRFTRCLNPVAKRIVYPSPSLGRDGKPLPEYHAVPGRYGVAWDYMEKGLSQKARRAGQGRAEYDAESMALIRKHGGLKNLVMAMCPSLSPERQARLIQTIESISHAKQRVQLTAHVKEHGGDLAGTGNALKKLKAQLRRRNAKA